MREEEKQSSGQQRPQQEQEQEQVGSNEVSDQQQAGAKQFAVDQASGQAVVDQTSGSKGTPKGGEACSRASQSQCSCSGLRQCPCCIHGNTLAEEDRHNMCVHCLDPDHDMARCEVCQS